MPRTRSYVERVVEDGPRRLPPPPAEGADSTSSGSPGETLGSGSVATAVVTSSLAGTPYTPTPQNGHIFQRSTSGRSHRAQVRLRRVWHHGQKMNSGSTRCLHTGHELWTWMPCRNASSSNESSYSWARVLGGRRITYISSPGKLNTATNNVAATCRKMSV